MRRSTSRTVSRYWLTLVRSPGPSFFCRRAISSLTQSSRLAFFRSSARAVRRAAALAEQALEDDARMGLGRQRRRGRRPRQIVLVDAGVAVVALAHRGEQIHRQLERRQPRLLADLLRRDLIDRRAQVVVGALGPLRLGGAQEGGVGRRVRAGIGVLQLQIRDHRELIDQRRQRAEDRRKLGEICAGRSPPGDVAAHRHVDKAQAAHRIRRRRGQRGHRRNHRIQQRQRQRRPHAAQETSAAAEPSS